MSGFSNNYYGSYGSGYYQNLGATKCCNLASARGPKGDTGPAGPRGGTGPAGIDASDERDKSDITSLEPSLAFLSKLRPVRFTWNMRRDETRRGQLAMGFIAQEMQALQAEMSQPVPGLVIDDEPEYLLANYAALIPIMTRSIQELEARVIALEMRCSGCRCDAGTCDL